MRCQYSFSKCPGATSAFFVIATCYANTTFLRIPYAPHPCFDSILTCRELCFFGVTGAGAKNDGFGFLNAWRRVFLDGNRHRAAGFSKGASMNAMYVVSAILAGLLLVYLFVALLKPEWF